MYKSWKILQMKPCREKGHILLLPISTICYCLPWTLYSLSYLYKYFGRLFFIWARWSHSSFLSSFLFSFYFNPNNFCPACQTIYLLCDIPSFFKHTVSQYWHVSTCPVVSIPSINFLFQICIIPSVFTLILFSVNPIT